MEWDDLGKRTEGSKVSNECHESIQRKLHYNHLTIQISKKKKKAPDVFFLSDLMVFPNVQIHMIVVVYFRKWT